MAEWFLTEIDVLVVVETDVSSLKLVTTRFVSCIYFPTFDCDVSPLQSDTLIVPLSSFTAMVFTSTSVPLTLTVLVISSWFKIENVIHLNWNMTIKSIILSSRFDEELLNHMEDMKLWHIENTSNRTTTIGPWSCDTKWRLGAWEILLP